MGQDSATVDTRQKENKTVSEIEKAKCTGQRRRGINRNTTARQEEHAAREDKDMFSQRGQSIMKIRTEKRPTALEKHDLRLILVWWFETGRISMREASLEIHWMVWWFDCYSEDCGSVVWLSTLI